MPRADLLVTLVHAATAGDRGLVRKTVEAIAAEERAKKHLVLAQQLERQLQAAAPTTCADLGPVRSSQVPDMLDERTPRRTFGDLVLPAPVEETLRELVEEHHRATLLEAYSLRPRHRVLLTGPPGNGKTSAAEALAHALMVPLVTVRYEALITSFLGETAAKLKKLFDYVRSRRCVLFFDEFDTLGKERGDAHETGEIKRVVSSLLRQIDELPPHVVVVCATNHPELLDRAVWHRFEVQAELPPPGAAELGRFVELLATRMNLELGSQIGALALALAGANSSEVEDFVTDMARRHVLALPGSDLKKIVTEQVARRGRGFAAQGR